jgi:methionyl-tRNA formyltransferase
MALRLAYMGTPSFAVPALQALLATPHQVVAVYTQAPKPKGRGHQVQESPVHVLAKEHHIEVRTPKTLRDPEVQAAFAALDLDLAIVAAYGLILPKTVLEAPRRGCLNLHGSLLPRWRGAAPIQRAIEAGDAQTALCLMQMDEGLDTGPVYAHTDLSITAATTSATLADDMAAAGARLLLEHLDAIAAGTLSAQPQPGEGVTYARKIEKSEAKISWGESAMVIERRLRAFTPWPLLEFSLAGEPIKLLRAELATGSGAPGTILDDKLTIACGEGALRLLTVQRAGRGPVSGSECLRALQLTPGAAHAA